MNELFGLPMSLLMWVFLGALALVAAWSVFLAVRQPVLFRLAARNIPRRWGRSLLIVLGLTLATAIITTALATGDTVTHTVRVAVLNGLGHVDEIISSTEEGDIEITGEASQLAYIQERDFDAVRQALAGAPEVDGVMPVIWEAIAAQDLTTRQTEPRVSLMAVDHRYMEGFGAVYDSNGRPFDLAGLGSGEVLINSKAAKELGAAAGDQLVLYAGGQQRLAVVRDVITFAMGSTDPGLLISMADAQQFLDRQGFVKHIIISNKGGPASGEAYTDAVIDRVKPVLDELGLAIEPTKRDDLREADETGAMFSTFFITFGTFSIAAGILLIFLLFVMLAGERKPEMGIARAVGTERVHLIEMFMFEGLLYDVLAAAVGALIGVVFAFIMVQALGAAMAEFDLNIEFSVSPRSLVTGYAMGVVLTFIIVTLSAWRVSVLNIVTAIRNLPEPIGKAGGRASLAWGFIALAAGLLLAWAGLSAKQATPFNLGVSLVALSTVPIMRWSRVPDRVAFSVAGAAIVVWWLLPWDFMDPLLPELSMDFNIWVAAGLITVIGVTWVAIYNADLVVRLVMATAGRVAGMAPILKTALTYPLTNRFRTGVTLAMFTIVVFTLVTGGTTTTAFTNAFNDIDLYGGGFDVRVDTVQVNPITDLKSAITQAPGLQASDYEVVAAESRIAIEAKQSGSDLEFGDYVLRGMDDTFLDSTSYGFAVRARGYESDAAVWNALKSDANLAVVDDLVAPRRSNFTFGETLPDFRLEGFYIEDGTFDPVVIEVRDPLTGATRRLTVIGVLQDVIPFNMIGVITSQRVAQETFPEQATPAAYMLRLREGVDAQAAADDLEAAFLPNGLEATVLRDELDDLVAVNRTFNYLIQGFIGLGLIVGVAALGVVSARAVVERRQEIGVMRAIGFEQGRVQLSFLIEASSVAVAGIVIGTVLGLILTYNIISDARDEASWSNLRFTVPWLNLAVIYLIVMVAAVVTAFVPARQASRVYPAEALRYE